MNIPGGKKLAEEAIKSEIKGEMKKGASSKGGILEEAEELAKKMKSSKKLDLKHAELFCKLAGLEKELKSAGADNAEEIIKKAAKKLNIKF